MFLESAPDCTELAHEVCARPAGEVVATHEFTDRRDESRDEEDRLRCQS